MPTPYNSSIIDDDAPGPGQPDPDPSPTPLFRYVYGTIGNDQPLNGSAYDDAIYGLNGDDDLYGMSGNDRLFGGNGQDILAGGRGADLLDGGIGADFVDYGDASGAVTIHLDTGLGFGSAAQGDTYVSIEHVYAGSAFGDKIYGSSAGNDIEAKGGNDLLQGNGGRDVLLGGAGADTFKYVSTGDSNLIARDVIRDFTSGQSSPQSAGDKIDLSQIETGAGASFNFIGTSAFTGAGQIRYHSIADGYDGSSSTMVQVSTDSDSLPEMLIEVQGVLSLGSNDFIF